MRFGILGLPKSGKTTLFNIMTGAGVATDKYSMGKREAHLGVASVPDPRLRHLAELHSPQKVTPVAVEYVDFPGVSKGDFTGLDLAQFRDMEGIVHVARAFEDPEIPHPEDSVDPARDVETVCLELILADLAVLEGRLERLEKDIHKMRTDELTRELETLRLCREALEGETPLRALDLDELQQRAIRGYSFLSRKPLLHAINVGEERAADAEDVVEAFGLEEAACRTKEGVVGFCGSLEAELGELDAEEAAEFLADAGLSAPGLERVIAASYALLDVLTFYTVGPKECRAWTAPRGATAPEAAGRIHSDMEKGFIRAEVVAYPELVEVGSWNAAREAGVLRLEGKNYVVQDGDVMVVRFNV